MVGDIALQDFDLYLARMGKSAPDKLVNTRHFPVDPRRILDIGCADGLLTRAMAVAFPAAEVVGIDLEGAFVQRAAEEAAREGVVNVSFRHCYVRELLPQVSLDAPPERDGQYDVVTAVSLYHEVHHYGRGKSSVLKMICDVHELLRTGGVHALRDMLVWRHARETTYGVDAVRDKVAATPHRAVLDAFEDVWGRVRTVADMNHFLLKYPYYPAPGDDRSNWARELRENYLPSSVDDFLDAFRDLGMVMDVVRCYALPYLAQKWAADFGLGEEELGAFTSTGRLVARRV
jgi:SAM-dependent methyltransferase